MIMKRMFLLLIGTFLACAVSPLNGQDLTPRGEHPRPFFTPERIANSKARMKTEPGAANAKSIEELQSRVPRNRGEAVCRKNAERHRRPEVQ